MAAPSADSDEQNFWPGYVDSMVNMVMYLLLLIAILAMAVMYFSMRARDEAKESKATELEMPGKPFPKALPGPNAVTPVSPSAEELHAQIEQMRQTLNNNEVRYKADVAELKEKLRESDQRYKASGLAKVEKPNQKESGNNMKSTPDANLAKDGASDRVVDASGTAGSLPKGVEQFALRPSVLIVRFRPGTVDLSPDEAKRMNETFIKHFEWNASLEQSFTISSAAVEGLSESNRMAFYRVVAVRNHLLSIGVPAARIRQRIEPVPAARQSGTEGLEIRIQKTE
ncbi:vesicle formation protein [Herbaspirillum sp. WGmk3]|uniref:vesicle formation protein n=1 Tax=Herbaspirillum sp. WGmk3 TaxID=2919925 RepID=UPI0020903067|nr:vesicle formation protein [Herbaspirillum sp. WGmk3]MCO4855043.1 vesicle formation protein [Herbaspirillum sp. WGmk3]